MKKTTKKTKGSTKAKTTKLETQKRSSFPKLQPLMSEKSLTQAEVLNTYTFITESWARKPMIKDLITKIYGVEVLEVRTSNSVTKTQLNRFGLFGGDTFKKCFVRLKEGSKINLTAGV